MVHHIIYKKWRHTVFKVSRPIWKKFYLKSYEVECSIPNCYVCNRWCINWYKHTVCTIAWHYFSHMWFDLICVMVVPLLSGVCLNGNLHTEYIVFVWSLVYDFTSNGSWCMGIKGEMSGTVCVTFTWDMYIYIYIWVVYSLYFLLFVHYCNLMVCVVYWVGKWRPRGSTGMFGNLMAIYHIMLQFIQNHYKSTFS